MRDKTNTEATTPDSTQSFDDRSAQSRREFLRTASAPAVLAALGISLASCSDENVVGPDDPNDPDDPDSGITISGNQIILDLTKDDTQPLTQEGGFLLISQADTMAVNVDGSTIRAFTSTCTHQQCTINRFDDGVFQCPCHGSQYNTSGEVVQGPAPDPLTEYGVSRDDDTVTITK